MPRWTWFLLSSAALTAGALATLTAPGCGGGPDCNSTYTKYCHTACECSGGGECRIGAESSGGTGTLSFPSEADCTGLLVTLGCAGGGPAGADYPGCTTALDNVNCWTDPNGDKVMEEPTACATN